MLQMSGQVSKLRAPCAFPGDRDFIPTLRNDDPPDWDDPFDPRTWVSNPDVASALDWTWFYTGPEHRLEQVLIAREDRDLADTYRWILSRKKVRFDDGVKIYVYRKDGSYSQYLHREVMLRVSAPPSPNHIIVDHINGNSLDNRRSNLRWATIAENNSNKFGFAFQQRTFDFTKELYDAQFKAVA